jgi:hypothetical protein
MNPLALLGIGEKIAGFATGIDFNAVGNVMKSIGASIVKYWQYWLIALLFAANLFTGYELKHTRDKLTAEVAAHIKDINDFKTAQAEADKNAQTLKDTLTKESKANADQADSNYSVLLSKYRSSLLRFSSNQSHPGSIGDNQLSASQGGNGPSSDSDLPKSLTISGSDAKICAVNTARLVSVHDWAVGLPKAVK